MTLPSNSSMDVYPNNTTAKFTTVLSQPIDLTGDWEVALSEICVPANWNNITSDQYFFVINNHLFRLPNGFYPSVKSLLEKMIELINDDNYFEDAKLEIVRRLYDKVGADLFDEDKIGILYEQRNDRVAVFLPRHIALSMSEYLAEVLGFRERNHINNGPTAELNRAERHCGLFQNLLTAYVYCDLLEHMIVGDTKVQLLRTVNVDTTSRNIVNQIYTSPIYVPLQKKQFDSIELNIMSDTGDPVPFVSGKSVIVLHFRRSSNPYFLSR
jgi:hypothetical protein